MSVREDLKAYVDGELTPDRRAEVESALAADPGLQQEVEFMRVLGFEIKRMAAEAETESLGDKGTEGQRDQRASLVDRFRQGPRPWWHPYSTVGRFAYSGAFALLLFAVFFPVFAQSKSSAKRTAMLSEARMREMSGSETAASTPESKSPATLDFQADGGVSRDRDTFGYEGGGMAQTPTNEAPGRGAGESGSSGRPVTEGGKSEGLNVRGGTLSPSETREAAKRGSTLPQRSDKGTERKQAGTGTLPGPSLADRARMVIQNADMTVRVDEVAKAVTEARSLARALGGFVEQSNTSGSEGGTPSGFVTMRVPSTQFDTAVKRLTSMGEVVGGVPNISGQDVTKEFADLNGRLGVLRAEADSYVTMLRGARRIGEIMEIKDRLSQVRQEIASLEGQRLALKDQSMLSTITARFEQKPKVGEPEKHESWSEDTWATAVNGLASVGRFLGQLGIFLFVFAPIWIPPVALFWWLARKGRAV